MTGTISITVKNSRNSYQFNLKRNITILCGESGRGKTTLYNMIADYNRYGKGSAVKLVCSHQVLALNNDNWQEKIEKTRDSVIVIDEDNFFIRSQEFAEAIKNSNNYYLLITRDYLEQLPISVEEIYEISGSRNKRFKKVYQAIDNMYHEPIKKHFPVHPAVIITEDSKAGFQFFSKIADEMGIKCISANGKSNIYKLLSNYEKDDVLIIADGAAFGTEIRDIVKRQKLFPNKISIFLPESFEWLILKSGLVCNPLEENLVEPENYIESEKYFSWERYFTYILIELTKNNQYKRYSKSQLADFYIHKKSISDIKKIMKNIDFQ